MIELLTVLDHGVCHCGETITLTVGEWSPRQWGHDRTGRPECPGGPMAEPIGLDTPDRTVTSRSTPPVVTLCGSARFGEAFAQEQAQLSLAGWVVLSLSGVPKEQVDADADLHARLDELHRARIDMSQRIHVIDVAGYIGESTRSEIEYAQTAGKAVTYLSAARIRAGSDQESGS